METMLRRMWYWVLGVMVGLFIVGFAAGRASASPFYITLGAGASDSKLTANGIWYQEGFPYKSNPHSWAAHAGVGYQIAPWLAVEGLYHDFGHAHISADWVRNDDNYNPHTANHCNGPCNPLNHGDGTGTARGVSLSVLPTWHVTPQVALYGRVGVLFYKTHWAEQWMCCKTKPEGVFQPTNETWQGDGPGNAQPDASGRTSLYGLGARYGNFGVEYTRTGKFAKSSSGFNQADTLTLSYRLYF
jgi:hypothetical protein